MGTEAARKHAEANTDAWFPTRTAQEAPPVFTDEAQPMCRACPVQPKCLEYVIVHVVARGTRAARA